MGFRIGRSRAHHVYPEPSRVVPPPPILFARNSAQGPTVVQSIGTATDIQWSVIEFPGGPGVDVPITPLQPARRVRIICVVQVLYLGPDLGSAFVELQAAVGGVPFATPLISENMVHNDQRVLSYLLDVTLPAGTSQIEMQVTATNTSLTLAAGGSTIDIQELPAATG